MMKILGCPNGEFQSQFTAFSNAINELTTLAIINRVPIPISRDISGLNDIIIKCKRDRLKNLDSQNDHPALRSELNVSAIVPLTHGSSDPSIERGNLRSGYHYDNLWNLLCYSLRMQTKISTRRSACLAGARFIFPFPVLFLTLEFHLSKAGLA